MLVIGAGSETTRSSKGAVTEFLDSRFRLQRQNERRWKILDGDVLAVAVRGAGACWSVRGCGACAGGGKEEVASSQKASSSSAS